ncbi:protein of unknown function DUF974 [Echinococcus multilocularis]|uniref:Trafficking protein particle complex subunit 13 N-terminal domain-containing protein n=1 Tax=Echinococcus multilocularis TaxID=6211 RepID=A0A068YNU3_ECHMU|nr:protein of unknown function DUF974 [Echinococcus multilocularis]
MFAEPKIAAMFKSKDEVDPVYQFSTSLTTISASKDSFVYNFRILFLGETFLCHINLHNESGVECKNVVLKVAVQGSGEYTPLPIRGVSAGHLPSVAEGGGVGGWPMEGCRLRPQENFNAVVQHDLKELGENTLICVVSYVARVPSSSIAVSSSLPQPPPLTGLQQPTTATVGASSGSKR